MLKWLKEKLETLAKEVRGAYLSVFYPTSFSLASERGDTNFISILIILGIVIIVAGIFIGFKDTIVAQVQEIVGGFTIH